MTRNISTATRPFSMDWENEPVPDLSTFETYQQAYQEFEWDIPDRFNIAADIVTRHADTDRVSMYQEIENGGRHEYTFADLDRRSNELANALQDMGVSPGDRVAILSSRSDRIMIVHLANWKLGAVSVPLSVLYGPSGLQFRLANCEPRVVFADPDGFDGVAEVCQSVDSIEHVIGIGEHPAEIPDVSTHAMADLDGQATFSAHETRPDDPALILYTSGTTGMPKGVEQTHETLIGWLPGFQMCFELPWHGDDLLLYATPDLAWIGGLNLVLGAWHYGFPVFVYDSQSGFDPKKVYEHIQEYGISRAVLVPGMLKAMAQLDASQFDLSSLTVVMSGSEPVTETLYQFVTDTLGANLNEMYGQTEALHIITSCSQWFDSDPGSLGYPVPGHHVAIVDDDGENKPQEETGNIALKRPDPVMFSRLWADPEGTREKFIDGDWMDTDDLGYEDADGQFWFTSRSDNVIITRGYRVGPAEIEDSIMELDAVGNVGVIGVPDNGSQSIKAFVALNPGYQPSEVVKKEIRDHVRNNLAKHEYPKEIDFINELPTTVTGKIKRHELEQMSAHDE